MLYGLPGSVHHKQPRLIAPLQRLLRNQFFRKHVIKIAKTHIANL